MNLSKCVNEPKCVNTSTSRNLSSSSSAACLVTSGAGTGGGGVFESSGTADDDDGSDGGGLAAALVRGVMVVAATPLASARSTLCKGQGGGWCEKVWERKRGIKRLWKLESVDLMRGRV